MQFNIPAEHKNASGVYIIRTSINAKVYVGSTKNFLQRYREHTSRLARKQHHSPVLQSFVSKYGAETLSFDLVELAEQERGALVDCEQKWLNHYRCYEREQGFNICPLATSCLGVKHSEETKAKLSRARTGSKMSEEHRRAHVERLKGRKHSEETKQKMSLAKRAMSEETKQKMSASRKGRIISPEWAEKTAQKNRGRKNGPISEETRLKLIAVHKNRSPETIAKGIATRRANKLAKAAPLVLL